jgi:hemolysin III
VYHGERLNGFTHLAGAALAAAGSVMLVVIAAGTGGAMRIASFSVFGATLVSLYTFSTLYHSTRGRAKAVFRKLDHCAIYLLIAGTYTPFALVKIGDTTGLVLLGLVWSITAVGAAAKLLLPGRLVIMSYVLYLLQGWVVVAVWEPFTAAVSGRVMVLLAAGGVLYTVGVVFHLWERLRFHNAIWHAMVLIASACHFAAIIDCVALAPVA